MAMSSSAAGPSPLPGRIWFGLAGAVCAWTVQETLGAVLSGIACRPGLPGALPAFAPGTVRALTVGVSVVSLAVAGAAALTAWANWRGLSEVPAADAEAEEREPFLALAGLFVSVAFTLAIVWAGLPTVLLAVCRTTR